MSKTILVVEDNEKLRKEIVEFLIMENYDAKEASDGKEGYKMALASQPHLIISDIMMPIWDGYKMYEKLRKNPLTDIIPIIFLTALTSEEKVRIGMNLGADDYLKKPISLDALLQAVESKVKLYNERKNKFDKMAIELMKHFNHELRTPLTAILGYSEIMINSNEELSSTDIKEYAKAINSSGTRLFELVKKYLLYSELETVKLENSENKNSGNALKKISLQPLFEQVIIECIPESREKDIKVNFGNSQIITVEKYIKAVIKELLENAEKYSKEGDIIRISEKDLDGKTTIEFYNEGYGLIPEKADRLQAYIQNDEEDNACNGTEIGLAIVKQVVHLFNGECYIDSKPGKYFKATLIFDKEIH
ncbi:MAG: response regulator [Bacteroidota bacterium]|nr:response regulator [Bacteroidota bacterium]